MAQASRWCCPSCGQCFGHRSSLSRHIHCGRCRGRRTRDEDGQGGEGLERNGIPDDMDDMDDADPFSQAQPSTSTDDHIVADRHRFPQCVQEGWETRLPLNMQELKTLQVFLQHSLTRGQSKAVLGLMQIDREGHDENSVRYSTIDPMLRHLDKLDSHHVMCKDMKGPGDVDESVLFWFVPALHCIQQLLKNPSLQGSWEWEHQVQVNSHGERVYGSFLSGDWARDIELCEDGVQTRTHLLSVIFGSDGTPTPGGFDREAHPIYITSGNLCHKKRASDEGWEVAGIVPVTPCQKSHITCVRGRRSRLLLTNCLATLFESIKPPIIVNLQCSDGQVRRFDIQIAAGVVDRLEGESIAMSCKHRCYECLVPREVACDVARLQWGAQRWANGAKLRHDLRTAAFCGTYGENDEWRKHIRRPTAILKQSEGTPLDGLEVISVTRYQDAGSVLGCFPEGWHPLSDFFGDDLHRCLPNDVMHMVELGLFKHVLTAIHAKYAIIINEMASGGGADADHDSSANGTRSARTRWCWAQYGRSWNWTSWSNRVWQRLSRRLQQCGLSQHVAKAFLRHAQSIQDGDRTALWSGMAAHEINSLVKMLPFTLRDLLSPEIDIVRAWCAQEPDAHNAPQDPSEEIGNFLARLLAWVSMISREELTDSMVADVDRQAKALMQILPQVFPCRKWDGQQGYCNEWNFPKLHQMYHIADQIRR